MSTTTSQLVKDRIDLLWNLVLSSTSNPSYNRYLCKMIFRLAQDNEIKLQNSFFQMVCPCCSSFFLPSLNCIQKLYTMKKIRRLRTTKGKASENIKSIIFTSQLSGGKADLKSNSLVTTIRCQGCKTLLVNNLAPLEFQDYKPQLPLSISKTAQAGPKKENLQKALQKSKISKNNEEPKKELDLESFLQGFL